MVGAIIKVLLSKVTAAKRSVLVKYTFAWFAPTQSMKLRVAAAQVSSLVVEVFGANFNKYLKDFLQMVAGVFQVCVCLLVSVPQSPASYQVKLQVRAVPALPSPGASPGNSGTYRNT